MKYTKLYCALLLLALLSALLLYSAYTEVRLKTIDQLNNQQVLLAKEAAKGIEGFFNHYARLLNALSQVGCIADLDEHGKKLMEIFYQSHAGEIVAIARMDANGRIVHALPSSPSVIGTDLSDREYVQQMMKTHKPVVSDVIMAAHGFESIAFHVPVFINQAFDGSLVILIPFDHLAKRYLEGIKLAEDGYAWMISRKGVELYCPVPGHVGKSVYENRRDFPTILSMADEMVQGKEGMTTYLFDRVRGETVESVKKLAVYLPVRLPNNYWSIVVATPESEVLEIIQGFKNRCFLLVGIMLITGVLCSYYLGRAFMIVKEEAKRKQIEMALQNSKDFLDKIINSISDPIFVKDIQHRFVLVNDALCSLAGWKREEIIGRTDYDFFSKEQVDIFWEKDKAVFETGKESVNEEKITDSLGITRTIDTKKALYEDKAGNRFIVGIIRDITVHKRSEEHLRESEERYRSIFNHAPIGIMHFDQMGVIQDLNDKLAEIIGSPREKILGFNMLERVRDPASLQAVKDAIMSGFGYYEGDYLSITGNKTTPLRAICKGINAEDGKFLGGVGIFEDITERKRAEKGLKDSEQQLQSIIQGNPIPAFVIGKDHQVIYWNKALEEMSHIKANEVVGTMQHWRAFYSTARPCIADLLVDEVAPEEIFQWYKGMSKKSSLLEDAYEATDFFPELGVEGKWLHFTAAAIRDSLGTLVGAIETLVDVTERKKAEDALISANRQLNDIIEFLPDATAVLDMDKKVIAWNRAIEEMTGVSKKEMMGKGDHACTLPFYGDRRAHLLDLIDASDEELESKYQHVTRKGGILYAETYVPCVYGGHGAYVFATGAPLFDAHGNRVGAIESIRDITEQRQAREALRRSEEKYRELVENANSIILRMDSVGNVTFINEFAQRFFGYSEEEILGKNVVGTIVPPVETNGRDLRLMIEDIALNPDRYASNINENVRHNGERVWVAWTNKPIHYEDGKVVEVLCVGNDITERKQAEEELIESRQQLSDIIDFLPDATFVIDREGKTIAWNRAIEDMTGIRAVDMLGKSEYEYALAFYGERRPILIDLVFHPNLEIDQHYVAVERTDMVISGEAYMPALRGGGVYLYAKASALFDSKGNVVGAIESIRDITDRKLMEEAVAEAEAKYRSIFENSVMGIFQTTIDGRFISLNKALARILGYDSPEEALHVVTDIPRQLYVNPDRRSELLRLIVERGMVQEFEVQFFRKDKSVVWISLNIRAVRDLNGKIIHLEGIAQDITESKGLASQLNQAQKMEAIGTLAGGIAHDFNNILAPIIGYSELSLNAVPKGSRLHRNLEQILLSGIRAKDLVKQILTFSRKTELERRPVQVSLLIKETLKLLRSSLPSTIEIRRDLDEDAIDTTVMADPIQIHQVLMNLCMNASHAMRENGGVLSITLKNVDIDSDAIRKLPGVAPGSYLRLTVSDTGHGIDEVVRQRIFDPYFTTKGPSEGTGLGLALIYGIVKNLSGGIDVSSKPGEGATFGVYFPRTKTLRAPMVDRSVPLPTGKGLVLVVDDEKSIVDLLKGMLTSLGYDVAERYSSYDALQAFRARPDSYDLVITDQTMPHMTGIDLAREIQRIRADTPIILCTGFSEAIDENKAKLMGIKGFLMKPVALRDLAVTVNKILFQDKPIY